MADQLYDIYKQKIELTAEQKACLKYTGEKTLMVKGYAGAGKSVVLIAIAHKYLEKYGKNSKNKIAILTYQNTLVSTTKEFLKINNDDENGIYVSTINSYIKEIYDELVKIGKAPRRRYPFVTAAGQEIRINNVKKILAQHQKKYGKHRFHDIAPEFWIEEFDWMKQLNVWTNDEEYYMSLQRKGRGSLVKMSMADRRVAYQLFTLYCEYLEKNNYGDWADQALYLIRHPEVIPDGKKYEHILIDEAQDLTTAQMLAVMNLYKADMIVAMDANQKVHNRYWTPKSLGIDATTKKLTKSMRTTKQIDALAESVRSKNDDMLSEDDKSLRAIPEKDGKKPKLVCLENALTEQKYVVSLVEKYIKGNPDVTIGIIAAMNKQIKMYSEWLTSANIPHEQVTKNTQFSMAKPGVKVVTAYGAKGLEFNSVIIPMFVEGYFPFNVSIEDDEEMKQFMIKMRNLVYVSMTRARNLLTITYSGKRKSRFIEDMDPTLYEMVGEEKKPNTSGNRDNKREVGAQDDSTEKGGLLDYLEENGLEYIDKRDKGGCLWVVGGEEVKPILDKARKLHGSFWIYSLKGGSATKHRSGWFTKCLKK